MKLSRIFLAVLLGLHLMFIGATVAAQATTTSPEDEQCECGTDPETNECLPCEETE
jgi:hypothetical protein